MALPFGSAASTLPMAVARPTLIFPRAWSVDGVVRTGIMSDSRASPLNQGPEPTIGEARVSGRAAPGTARRPRDRYRPRPRSSLRPPRRCRSRRRRSVRPVRRARRTRPWRTSRAGSPARSPSSRDRSIQSWPAVATSSAPGRCARTASATAGASSRSTRSWTENPMNSCASSARVAMNPAFTGVSQPVPRNDDGAPRTTARTFETWPT